SWRLDSGPKPFSEKQRAPARRRGSRTFETLTTRIELVEQLRRDRLHRRLEIDGVEAHRAVAVGERVAVVAGVAIFVAPEPAVAKPAVAERVQCGFGAAAEEPAVGVERRCA